MIGPLDITMNQCEDNLKFITELTETNRVCWKIRLETGAAVLLCLLYTSPSPRAS